MARKRKTKSKETKKKKRVLKKVGEKLKGLGKKAGLVGKDIAFAQLLPFKKLMKRELDAKGIEHTDHIGDIAPKFLKYVVRKKNFEDRHAFSSIGTDSETEFHIVEEAASGIVTAIFTFFRELKKKREAAKNGGEPLTETEAKILDATEEVTDSLVEAGQEEAKSEVASQIQEFLFSWKGLVALLVLGVIIALAFRSKK